MNGWDISNSNGTSLVEYATTVTGAGLFILFALISTILLTFSLCSGNNTHISLELSNIRQLCGLLVIFLLNQIILNVFYILFGSINYNQANAALLCESTGVLLHYFFLTSAGIVLLMAISRFAKIFNDSTFNGHVFNCTSSAIIHLAVAVLVLITVLLPTNKITSIAKYHSDQGCWLNDIYVLLAAIPFGIMFLVILVFCFLICIQDKFKLLKHVDDERTTTPYSHSSFFNMSVFVCVLFLAITWVFAFLVMIPTPANISYLNAIFTTTYCVLNVCFAIFVLITSVLLTRLSQRSMSKQQVSTSRQKVVRCDRILHKAKTQDLDCVSIDDDHANIDKSCVISEEHHSSSESYQNKKTAFTMGSKNVRTFRSNKVHSAARIQLAVKNPNDPNELKIKTLIQSQKIDTNLSSDNSCQPAMLKAKENNAITAKRLDFHRKDNSSSEKSDNISTCSDSTAASNESRPKNRNQRISSILVKR